MSVLGVFKSLETWQPFKIDSLGLVTILGAKNLDRALRRLSQSHTCEFLPLFAPFVVASNDFMNEVPGAVLYNVTDGIFASDISGWLVRWLLSQKLGWNSSTLVISINSKDKHNNLALLTSAVVGFVAIMPMIICAILMLDWFAFANVMALAVTVMVRYSVLRQNREALDMNAKTGVRLRVWGGHGEEMVKTYCVLPGGKFVTIYCPRGIVIKCLLTSPRSLSPRLYQVSLATGWVATVVHFVTIGMASLLSQLVCVATLVTSSILVIKGVGYNENRIGAQLSLHLSHAREKGRSAAYIRSRLSPVEEQRLSSWHLFPARNNTVWWESYRREETYNRRRDDWVENSTQEITGLAHGRSNLARQH